MTLIPFLWSGLHRDLADEPFAGPRRYKHPEKCK